MPTPQIRLEELIAGAICKFGSINSIDIVFLMGGLQNANIGLIDDANYTLSKYFDIDTCKFINGYSLDSTDTYFDTDYTLRNLFESMQSTTTKKYLDSIDMEDFVLRKMRFLGPKQKEQLPELFSRSQLEVMEELFADCSLYMIITNNSEEVSISQSGLQRLFIRDHKSDIEYFCRELDKAKLDSSYIEDYLYASNLQKNASQVLTIKAYKRYLRAHRFNRIRKALVNMSGK